MVVARGDLDGAPREGGRRFASEKCFVFDLRSLGVPDWTHSLFRDRNRNVKATAEQDSGGNGLLVPSRHHPINSNANPVSEW